MKILDFGLARGTAEDAQFTHAGTVIGTPAYMAPEQANAEEVDARCDLFSLGSVLYRASTGELPFGGKDTLSVLKALATTTPTPPHRLVPSLSPAFSGLVMRLLAKDPDDRPQSARAVVEALAALERGEEIDTAPAPEGAPDSPPDPAEVRVQGWGGEGTGGKKKRPKKARSPDARRKRRPKPRRDWGRVVLAVALVLLGVAVLVLVFAAVRHATRDRAAAPAGGEEMPKTPLVIPGALP